MVKVVRRGTAAVASREQAEWALCSCQPGRPQERARGGSEQEPLPEVLFRGIS